MACTSITLRGIVQDCNGNLGGVAEVWLINRDSISAVTTKNTSSMNSTLNVNDNGSTYVTTELNLVFARMDAQKRLEMNALAKEEMAALVKDANGTWFYLGYDNPVTSSAGTGETGTQKSDNNQYTSTLLDDSTEYPFIVLQSAIDALLG